MRELGGREQLGKFSNIPLVINWDYLRKEVGLRKEEELFEKALGRFVFASVILYWLVSIIAVFVNTGYFYLSGVFNVDSLVKLVFWLSMALLSYALYLQRDRNVYLDKLAVKSLVDLKVAIKDKPSEIELTEYMSHEMINLIDDVLGEFGDYFIPELLEELLHYPLVQQASVRLGLSTPKWEKILKMVRIEAGIDAEKWLKAMIIESFLTAYENRFEYIDELAVFLFLVKHPLAELLSKFDVHQSGIAAIEIWARNYADNARYLRIFERNKAFKPTSVVNRSYTSRYPATLQKFARDYTAEVVAGKFTMSIAREEQLAKVIEILCSGDSYVPLITGQPGVGKTNLVKSLAVRMVVEDVPAQMQDKRLVGLDFGRAFALSGGADEFKTIMEKALEDVVSAGNIILVIDDIDELVNIRKEFSSEIVSLITRAIDALDVQVVATSTIDGYNQHIKPFKALAALFQPVELPEPSDEVAIQILLDSIPLLEARHNVRVAFETFVRIVKLSRSFAFEKVLPDKALDLLDEAMARASSEGLHFLTEATVDKIVSSKVGVNVGKIDSKEAVVLTNMEEEIHRRVVGQDAAVRAVSAALRRARAGLTDSKRPIASFLFFGPTGVGKTELAKAVSKAYYGDEKLLIRLDMSEYQEDANLGRLLGETRDGEFVGGLLTDAVRSRPYSLILLDEIEKANPRVLDVFLQILDEGHVTDGSGRKVSFTNTIIIATSNVAANQIADLILEGKDYKHVYQEVMPKIRQFLRIEFLNRFDQVVMFKPLLKVDIEQITRLMLDSLVNKLAEKGIHLRYTKELISQLATLGYNPIYGARELRRVIQDKVENRIAEQIVSGALKSGGEVIIERV